MLEYIGYYNEFQKGALAPFYRKSMTESLTNRYIKTYIEWKQLKDQPKQKEQADAARKQMQEIEEQFPYEKLVTLRQFALKMMTQKHEAASKEEDIKKKAAEMESSKKRWFMSKADKE